MPTSPVAPTSLDLRQQWEESIAQAAAELAQRPACSGADCFQKVRGAGPLSALPVAVAHTVPTFAAPPDD